MYLEVLLAGKMAELHINQGCPYVYIILKCLRNDSYKVGCGLVGTS